jgi:hypothetical protein
MEEVVVGNPVSRFDIKVGVRKGVVLNGSEESSLVAMAKL